MKADELKALVPSEAVLCAAFIAEVNKIPGCTCYPETGGYDIVVALPDSRQIGVEAKLQLNAKVAEQILPSHGHELHGAAGPDHRLVIVRSITEANEGIARMLQMLGVEVWAPSVYQRLGDPAELCFRAAHRLSLDADVAEPPRHNMDYHYYSALYDFNPPQRIQLPDVAPTTQAGIPAPVRMTPWKMAAVRVLARLRAQGHIMAKEIAAEGCSPSIWTQKWLDRGAVRGQWVESARTPALDKQHPELYAVALERARNSKAAA
ncbi:hypothetical protein GIY21_00915 [Xanthomonas sontii]|uniref:Uncharacterized protein n=1 Tax=Xanthomonas sontii TaxID=2650745 RepID=A0A6N7Q3C1_9XANT|nr:hypothetical protein [Xanthomonas sontii]MRG98848.1 hypothetical protein [Xanthomonas sontii]MRH73361.1 hypothetical protein [Xanthomonas sontii]